MKKITTLLLFIICTTVAFGQENSDDQPVNLIEINNKKHELKIDALEGLAVPALDISYEYVLSRYSGLGASVFVNLEGDNGDTFEQDFAFTAFYRQYFFNKKDYGARGFFAEGLLQYASGESDDFISTFITDDVTFQSVSEDWNKVGIGFAIGQKWVSRNGFVLEISAGGGRYFGNDDDSFSPEGFFRGGLSVGYRF